MKFVPRAPREGINVSADHPLKEAAILIVGLSAIFALIATAVILFVDLVIVLVPADTEARVLGAWVPDGLTTDTTENTRVNEARALLQRLASHWPDAPYTFRLEVTESPEPNAMALPGGLIVVTSALFDGVETENELAFVLGHELGHFRNRDHIRRLGRGVALALLFAVVGGGEGGADLGIVVTDLTLRGFSRDQESDADRFGLEIVQAEYGHVDDSWSFFQRLIGAARPDSDLFVYLSTHPAAGERIEEMQSYARQKGWPLEGPKGEWKTTPSID